MLDTPVRIRTNNVPRFTVDAWELSPAERSEFDYIDWPAIDAGEDSATFLRYKGRVYDLAEFSTTAGLPRFSELVKWDGYLADSFFSGVVIRYVGPDYDAVIVGTFVA